MASDPNKLYQLHLSSILHGAQEQISADLFATWSSLGQAAEFGQGALARGGCFAQGNAQDATKASQWLNTSIRHSNCSPDTDWAQHSYAPFTTAQETQQETLQENVFERSCLEPTPIHPSIDRALANESNYNEAFTQQMSQSEIHLADQEVGLLASLWPKQITNGHSESCASTLLDTQGNANTAPGSHYQGAFMKLLGESASKLGKNPGTQGDSMTSLSSQCPLTSLVSWPRNRGTRCKGSEILPETGNKLRQAKPCVVENDTQREPPIWGEPKDVYGGDFLEGLEHIEIDKTDEEGNTGTNTVASLFDDLSSHQSPSLFMYRLKELMNKSRETQEQLQTWDEKHGLPRSHSATMTHTSRSRRQLEEGKILPKWNGAPLIGGTSNERGRKKTKNGQAQKKIVRKKGAAKKKGAVKKKAVTKPNEGPGTIGI